MFITNTMTRDRWEEIVNLVEAKFVVETKETKEDDFDRSVIELLIFEAPMAKIKLEFVSKPKVIDKKVSYSNRVGAGSQIEYIYSPTDKVERLLVYRWDEVTSNWLPMSTEAMNLF